MKFLAGEDPDEARKVIGLEWPSFQISSLAVERQGLDNFTFLVNDEWIFRFPRGEWGQSDSEVWALRQISGRTTLATPRLEFCGSEWHCLAYRRIPGIKLLDALPTMSDAQRTQAASVVGKFLSELHAAIDPDMALSAGVRLDDDWSDCCADVQLWIEAGKCPVDWQSFLQDCLQRMLSYSPVPPRDQRLIHQDLHAENVIVEPATMQVVGVIDFGDVVVGDLHTDLAIAGWIDYSEIDAMCDSYEGSSGMKLDRQRVRDYYLVSSVSDIATGKFDCSEEVAAAVAVWRLDHD